VWFAPQGAVDGFLARGELSRLAIDTASTEGPVGLTVRRGGEVGEGARLLIEVIHEVVRQRAEALAAAARPRAARRSAGAR
jgi:LysR family pca operon transcriptional activator